MALNPAVKHLIQTKLAHSQVPQWAIPIAEVRQGFRNLWTPAITGEPVSIQRIEDVTISSADAHIPMRVYAPDGPGLCPIMLYFHGVGYVKGGIAESDAFCRNLARASRHMVLSIDYRLAPEHRFPAAALPGCTRSSPHFSTASARMQSISLKGFARCPPLSSIFHCRIHDAGNGY